MRMVSMQSKLQALNGLIDTKDVDEKTNQFLKNVCPKGLAAAKLGQVTGFSEAQTEWIENVYDRHFS
jgi:hypothetical protein